MIKINKTRLSCVLLIFIFMMGLVGCTAVVGNSESDSTVSEVVLGTGEKQFLLTVTDGEGEVSAYRINTEKTTVGDALVELKIIEGENGPYGMYIKSVNGMQADYNDGGKYWAFYVNGEYATSGVDTTEIQDGAEYSLRVQK